MEQIKKQVSHAFGKDVYLVGEDKDGIKYWLEAPKWVCDWYWGFGCIETYQRNRVPSDANDIDSHQHFSGFVGQQEKYDFEKRAFVKSDYVHNIYDNSFFTKLTFDKKQGWELSELFSQFYLLQKMAGYCHKKPIPGSNLTTVERVDNSESIAGWYNEINTVMIPKITAEIIKILTPDKV